jgi:hypothetical protein
MLRGWLLAVFSTLPLGCIAANPYEIFGVIDGGASPDAGPRRDAGADLDGGPDTDDAGTPDAGCTVSAEVCDGDDDDCNGIVDDGCPYYFGRPSPVVLGGDVGLIRSPYLSADGQRLYYVTRAGGVGRVVVAERSGIDARFEPPAVVSGVDLSTYDVFDVSLTVDELEIFVTALSLGSTGVALFRAARSSRGASFGPMSSVFSPALSQQQTGVGVSPDGGELFFAIATGATGWRIMRALRSTDGGGFEAPVPIVLPSYEVHDMTPRISDDGMRLFFSRANVDEYSQRLVVAERRSLGGLEFGAPTNIAELMPPTSRDATNYAFVSERTGEIFFTSRRAWSAATEGAWRARLCRDAACVEERIACPSGMTSPDFRHCYFLALETATTDVAEAQAACDAAGAELVSIHSDAERALVQSFVPLSTDPAVVRAIWLGASDAATEGTFEWSTGEPLVYTAWYPGEPNDFEGQQDCAVQIVVNTEFNTFWDDSNCAVAEYAASVLCETELWPW